MLSIWRPAPMQFSPLMPGASALEQQTDGSLDRTRHARAAGHLERRYVMALALRALAGGAPFTILAPNDRGGTRLRKELQAFGCTVEENARRHHRIVTGDAAGKSRLASTTRSRKAGRA